MIDMVSISPLLRQLVFIRQALPVRSTASAKQRAPQCLRMLACWPPPMCSGGRSPAISVDFGSLWVATQSSWPAAGVLRHDTHIFLWMATLIVRRLSYRIRIFISENNDHTIIHFGKFVSYVFSEMLILRGKVVSFISENSYDTYFRKIRMIRIFIFKIRIDTYFHY